MPGPNHRSDCSTIPSQQPGKRGRLVVAPADKPDADDQVIIDLIDDSGQGVPTCRVVLTRQQRESRRAGLWLCAKENDSLEEKSCPVPGLVGPAQRRSGPMAVELPDGRSESNDVLEGHFSLNTTAASRHPARL